MININGCSNAKIAPLVLGLGVSLWGCQQADPPGTATASAQTDSGTSSGDTDSSTESSGASGSASGGQTEGAGSGATGDPTVNLADYFPMVDGATWTFQNTSSMGAVSEEIEVLVAGQWKGNEVFELRDNEDANGRTSTSFLQQQGSVVARVHKEIVQLGTTVETVDYDPGFVRFDTSWLEGEVADTSYVRREYDGAGTLVTEAMRNVSYTLESLSTSVTVPAGTFDCIVVLRIRMDTMETKRFWFAEGVGKVKRENIGSGSLEELVSYDIP